MIPFARILNYGNVLPKPAGLKKINTYGLGHLFLTEDGDLYAYGTNSGGRFGTGNTDPISGGKARLVLSGVSMIYCHTYFTIAAMMDGTWKAVGSIVAFNLPITHTWTDVSSYFSTLGAIKKVSITRRDNAGNATVYALTYDGILYGMGSANRGQLGTGTTTSSLGVFKQINTNCSDVVNVAYETVVVLKSDGTVWFTGNYGLTSGTTDIKSFTSIGETGVLSIHGDGLGGELLYVKNNGLYVRGIAQELYNLIPSYGAGTNWNIVLPFSFSYNNFSIVTDEEGPIPSAWISNGTTHYGSGPQTSLSGRMGYTVSSSDGKSFTLQTMTLPPDVKMGSVSSGGYHSSIIGTDGKFYGSGAFGGFTTFPGSALVNYPGVLQSVLYYTQMDLPIP